MELKPGHSTGLKELEQSAHAGALLEQATALFEAEEFDRAAEALDKVLDVSSECARVHFISIHGFFLHFIFAVILSGGQCRSLELVHRSILNEDLEGLDEHFARILRWYIGLDRAFLGAIVHCGLLPQLISAAEVILNGI